MFKGFELVGCPDISGRRGLWMRATVDGAPLDENDLEVAFRRKLPTKVELCAGREGADAFFSLEIGETADAKKIADLENVISTYRFAAESWDEVPRLLRRLVGALEKLADQKPLEDLGIQDPPITLDKVGG